MASLKDQLMQAGLANAKRARQADHAKRQAAKGRHEEVPAAELVKQARAEQLVRDQAANKAQQDTQAEKAIVAQIRQTAAKSASFGCALRRSTKWLVVRLLLCVLALRRRLNLP